MADSGTAAPAEPPAAPAAPTGPPFTLEVKTLAGEPLATIPDALGSWLLADVVAKLPEVLPGHKYELLRGEAVLGATAELGLWAQPVDGKACVTAVVARTPEGKVELDLALIKEAGELNLEKVREFLRVGADATFRHDPEGVWGSQDAKTALHMAIQARKKGKWEGEEEQKMVVKWKAVIDELLSARADVNAVRSSSDWRGCGSSSTAFDMILPYTMKDTDLLTKFLAAGADPDTKFETQTHSMRTDGASCKYALHSATKGGSLEAVRVLLDARANVNAAETNRYHNERGFNEDAEKTAIHIATEAGNLPMVEFLIERGADVNAIRRYLSQEEHLPDQPRETDDPRDDRFIPTVRCLPVRETALHLAIHGGHKAIVELLLKSGADASVARSRDGKETTVEELCAEKPEILEVVKAHGGAAAAEKPAAEKAAA